MQVSDWTFFPAGSTGQGEPPDENEETLPPAEDDLFKAGDTQAIYSRTSDDVLNDIDMG